VDCDCGKIGDVVDAQVACAEVLELARSGWMVKEKAKGSCARESRDVYATCGVRYTKWVCSQISTHVEASILGLCLLTVSRSWSLCRQALV
jgi:hypothetical protein